MKKDISLGEFKPGAGKNLIVKLSLSEEMDNEYQELLGKVKWVFSASQASSDSSSGQNGNGDRGHNDDENNGDDGNNGGSGNKSGNGKYGENRNSGGSGYNGGGESLNGACQHMAQKSLETIMVSRFFLFLSRTSSTIDLRGC